MDAFLPADAGVDTVAGPGLGAGEEGLARGRRRLSLLDRLLLPGGVLVRDGVRGLPLPNLPAGDLLPEPDLPVARLWWLLW